MIQTYFHYRVLSMSCVELARSFVCLANQGKAADGAGEFAQRVGIPAKSGGGGIIAVIPNKMSIAVWSLGLDPISNSLAGTAALELLSEQLGSSVF